MMDHLPRRKDAEGEHGGSAGKHHCRFCQDRPRETGLADKGFCHPSTTGSVLEHEDLADNRGWQEDHRSPVLTLRN